MLPFLHRLMLGLLLGSVPCLVRAVEPDKAIETVTALPGLVAFWTFGEEPGQPRVSVGTPQQHPLQEVGGPVDRMAGGPYSGYAVRFDGRHYFRIPHADLNDLNICGPQATVSMFAVVRLDELKRGVTIAGIWSEGTGAGDDAGSRQYAMLLHMPAYGGPNRLTPHISSEGGVTRRADGSLFPWCCDYAVNQTPIPTEEWVTLGFTYDAQYLRAYYNGRLEERPLDPVQDKRTDRYFTQEGPNEGSRGINPYYHGRGIFCYDPVLHARSKPDGGSDFTVAARYAVGSYLREAMKGRMAGLAVFNRALTDREMQQLHDSAGVDLLNRSP